MGKKIDIPPTIPPLEDTGRPPIVRYDDDSHAYWIDDRPVPSVSAILDGCTPKDALPWWGMRVGLAAVIRLFERGKLTYPILVSHDAGEVLDPNRVADKFKSPTKLNKKKVEKTLIEALVIEERLSTNHIKDDAADRGYAVHAAAEYIGTHDEFPAIEDFPSEYHGYIRALAKFWVDHSPEINRQEVISASRTHAYAGRWDLDANLKAYGRCLLDFKTSKDIYDGHFEQLRLYRTAEAEMTGEDVFDHAGIVNLRHDGRYVLEIGDHVSEDTVIAAAALWHARNRDAAAKPKRPKGAK